MLGKPILKRAILWGRNRVAPAVRYLGRVRGSIGAGSPIVENPAFPDDVVAATANLDCPSVRSDPHRLYARLRQEGSVVYLAHHRAWMVLGYQDCKTAMSRADVFSNSPYRPFDANLVSADPPDHGPVRRLIARSFSAPVVQRLTASATAFADTLPERPFDLVSECARPFSEGLSCELLGIDAPTLSAIRVAHAESQAQQNPIAAFIAALDGLADQTGIFRELQKVEGAPLDGDGTRQLIRFLWLAGTTTSERLVTHSILNLLTDEDLRKRVEADPSLVAALIEESLRLEPPEHILPRRTVCATTLGGVEIPADSEVYLCIAGANRDPDAFVNPEEIRFDREGPRHISFGYGVHHCIGAVLIRSMMMPFIQAMLARGSRFQLEQRPQDIAYRSTRTFRVPKSVIIRA